MTDRGSLKSQPPGYSFSSDSYTMFQTIFVSSGSLLFECADPGHETRTVLTSGDFLILRKGSTFALSSPDTGYGGICYLDYEPADLRQSGYSFSFPGGQWIEELVGLMQFALAHPRLYSEETLALMGRTVTWQALDEGLFRSESGSKRALAEYWTEQVRQIVHNTMYTGQDEYREKIGALDISYRQLSRYFKSETGMTIKHYHVHARIREAKRLLGEGGFPVTDIAHELNYPSSQKFAAQFKQMTGFTPREYRNGSHRAPIDRPMNIGDK